MNFAFTVGDLTKKSPFNLQGCDARSKFAHRFRLVGSSGNKEVKQPRREGHKFAYLTMKNSRFARFACAFFIFGHLAPVLVLFHDLK